MFREIICPNINRGFSIIPETHLIQQAGGSAYLFDDEKDVADVY